MQHRRMGVVMRLAVIALALAAAACTGGDDGGGGPVVQIGPDLGFTPPTNPVACQDGFPIQINPTFPQPFTAQGAPSCLLLTFFTGAQPPSDGTVVAANLFVGAVTGPMRFVRMRVLLQNPGSPACCSAEQYGEVFTPARNSITTVPLDFPITADHVPPPEDTTTIAAGDLVGLEILAPDVPIPGTWIRNGGGELGLPNYEWLPALSTRGLRAPTQNLRSEGSFSGFLPAYNLEFRAQ